MQIKKSENQHRLKVIFTGFDNAPIEYDTTLGKINLVNRFLSLHSFIHLVRVTVDSKPIMRTVCTRWEYTLDAVSGHLAHVYTWGNLWSPRHLARFWEVGANQ